MFSSVRVNDTERSNTGLVNEIGARQKDVTLNFITEETTEIAIANRVLDEFKAPKIELNVIVSSEIGKDVDLLDRVSVDYPLRIEPDRGNFLPVVGITKVGAATEPLPNTFGSLQIMPNLAFKVIEIKENVKDFTTILKLRQIGKDINDGVFNTPGSQLIGFGVIGESTIAEGSESLYNPSVVGAALIGDTLIA